MPGEPADPHDWTEPGVFGVAPGVYRIPLPLPADGLRAVNVYALTGGDELTLIDGGWAVAEARQALGTALAGLGAELGDIRRFLVTHIHRDHYTQAVELRRAFGSRVSLGAGERPAVELIQAGPAAMYAPQLRQLRQAGAQPVIGALAALSMDPRDRASDWEFPDDWLAPRQEIEAGGRVLRVEATPGHTQGHVVFADDRAGLLFAGDHVLPHITPSIGFEHAPGVLPLGDYLSSLRLIRAMPDLRLLPAHGPVTASTHGRVDELLSHHDERLGRCAERVAAGQATAYQVALVLRWTRRERRLAELDPFNQMLAVTETLAHLELLAAQGRVAVSRAGGVAYYQPAATRAAATGPAAAGPAAVDQAAAG